MAQDADFRAFMARYFPTFLLGFFTCLLSVALVATLWVDAHWRTDPNNPAYSLGVVGGLVLALCLGHFLLIRGQGWAIGVVLAVLAVVLLMALSLFGSGLGSGLLASSLLLPALALLVLNGKRHRQLRARLVELRRARQRR